MPQRRVACAQGELAHTKRDRRGEQQHDAAARLDADEAQQPHRRVQDREVRLEPMRSRLP